MNAKMKRNKEKIYLISALFLFILLTNFFNYPIFIKSRNKQTNFKEYYKILVISDIHDDISKLNALKNKVSSIKFDYIFFCGDAIDIYKNNDTIYKQFFTELEKIAPILWVPGNHEPNIYFNISQKEVTNNSKNLHKKNIKLDDKLYIVGLGGSLPVLTGYQWKYNSILFKELNFEKDFKYQGYPYILNNFSKCDDMYIKDLNETVEKAKKEGGEDIQVLYLTHIGPLYTPSNVIIENGEILYLGSKNLGEKFLEEDNSFIIIHGHSHTSEGYITLNNDKHIFNPGCFYKGHFGIVEIKKNKYKKWGVVSCTTAYFDV